MANQSAVARLDQGRKGKTMVEIILQARTPRIAELVQACADGALPFSGSVSLCSMVAAMGYKTTSLYEMVRSVEQDKSYRGVDSPPSWLDG